MKPRILLADDHTLIVEALKLMLQAEFDVVGTVGDGHALLQSAIQLNPDLVVADISMPLLNGLDAGEQLKKLKPDLKVIYLTQNRDPYCAAEAFRRNASGYVVKSSAASELIKAIREALAGHYYLSPAIQKEITDRGLHLNHPDAPEPKLRPREREVLQLLAEGRSMKEVATVLNISPRTVEYHKYRIMETLGVTSNAQLIQYAVKQRMVTP